VPKGYNPARVPRMLERKQAWIHAALERVKAERHQTGADAAWKLPREILLSALGQVWQVNARETDMPKVVIRETGPGQLQISGRIADEHAGRAALARWLTRQAYAHLPPRLEEISRQLGLAFKRVYVKRQRTRWGSCSRHKAISLNAKLLFLTPVLVRYVMIHELCHLAEMNHSPRFWSLVQKNHPDFHAHDRELRKGWESVPRWAC